MNKIVEELKKVGVFFIATVEEQQPRVRPFSSIAEYEGSAYICSGIQKEFYKQVQQNPHIEISGMYDGGTWIRVSATLKEDNCIEVQQAVLSDPTGPSQLYRPQDGRFITYKLENIKAYKYNFYAMPQEIKEN